MFLLEPARIRELEIFTRLPDDLPGLMEPDRGRLDQRNRL